MERRVIGFVVGTDRGVPTETDEALLALVAGGDEVAFSALYDRYAGPVYSLLLRVVADRQVAEELTQEVFWRVWRRAGGYDPARGRPASWVLGMAHHAAVDELRRRRARPALTHDDPGAVRSLLEAADTSPDAHALVLRGIGRDEIAGALAGLPGSQRECVDLAYFGGLTQSEIAGIQDVALGTVKSGMCRGLRNLRAGLQERGVRADSF